MLNTASYEVMKIVVRWEPSQATLAVRFKRNDYIECRVEMFDSDRRFVNLIWSGVYGLGLMPAVAMKEKNRD